jgi:hypothetical protein
MGMTPEESTPIPHLLQFKVAYTQTVLLFQVYRLWRAMPRTAASAGPVMQPRT